MFGGKVPKIFNMQSLFNIFQYFNPDAFEYIKSIYGTSALSTTSCILSPTLTIINELMASFVALF